MNHFDDDAAAARGDVVTGVHDRPERMGDSEWRVRCWAYAVKGDGQNSLLGNDLVRVFALFDDARKERDALAQRVRVLEAAASEGPDDAVCDRVIKMVSGGGMWALINNETKREYLRAALTEAHEPG